jgi:50S ribosomal protein L16 3-hydroxylase
MAAFAEKALSRISWSASDAATFLGQYLTMPKAHVVFAPGRARRRLRDSIVRLDPKSQLLYSGRRFFINGEAVAVRSAALKPLADRRWAHGAPLASAGLADLISGWQRSGYVHFEAP